jgi:hypothetical protein
MVSYHISMYGLYRLYNQQIFLIWEKGQNMIISSYDFHLSSFKLCLDREDDIYAMKPFFSNFEHFYFLASFLSPGSKQHRKIFPNEMSYRDLAPLEIVCTYLSCPMKTPSLEERIYFLTFIDDCSRKTWVYFLKHKSETFDKFKKFKALVEKQCGLSIKILRSDRGGEFKSNRFLEYWRYHGIQN